MGAMKRFALSLAALGVIGSSAFAVSTVHAYQPVDAEELLADPDEVALGGTFEAVVKGCFPGEPGESGEEVLFIDLGADPDLVAVGVCELPAFEARVTFEAPTEPGTYRIVALLPEQDPDDLSGRPTRFLEAFYLVTDQVIDLGGGAAGGEVDGGAVVVTTGGSDDNWPNFLSSAGFYRVFLALLGLMAGIFFVWLWRRRREDERVGATYGAGAMPPPDPSNPSMA